jgi:hypothetical protein
VSEPVSCAVSSVREFLATLFGSFETGYIECRALPSQHREFYPVRTLDGIAAFTHAHRHENVYIGIATRNDTSSGKLENCAQVGALYVDIDFKVLAEPEARARLAAFPFPPSMIVWTGGGLHVYWLLREPLDLRTEGPIARDLLRRAAFALGGDLSAAECARVLRLPGGRNYKYTPPPLVTLEQCETDRRYNVSELLELLPAEPVTNGATSAGFRMPSTAGVGDRHLTLFRAGRSLKSKGLSPEAVLAALLVENQRCCVPPLSDAQVREQITSVFQQGDRPGYEPSPAGAEEFMRGLDPDRGSGHHVSQDRKAEVVPTWPLYDASLEWDFPVIVNLIETLLPLQGVVWWGGLPKRFKSLLLLYLCLAIACRRAEVCKHFKVLGRPLILYISREDPGGRLKERIHDILAVWGTRPEPRAIQFVIRPHIDLLNPEHITWIEQTCRELGITMLVLDTWTSLSPTADPLGTKEQAQLAVVVDRLRESLSGLVVVVDHSRKNRPDGQPISSADIHGPYVKWASADHVVMLELTGDRRRLEVFVEGKDIDTGRFFLTVSQRGSQEEKFAYAGSVEEVADAQRAVGNRNREAVFEQLRAKGIPLSVTQLVELLKAKAPMSSDTVGRHVKALVLTGRVVLEGNGKSSRYSVPAAASPHDPSAVQTGLPL